MTAKEINQIKQEEARKIARIISGTWDWQGVRPVVGTSGLKRRINAYFNKKYGLNNTMRACENPYGDTGESEYCLTWDEKKALRLAHEADAISNPK